MVDTFSHNLLKKGYFIIIKLVGIDFEFDSLFKFKYGSVYMNILKTFDNSQNIFHTNIRIICKRFEINNRDAHISLTPEHLK